MKFIRYDKKVKTFEVLKFLVTQTSKTNPVTSCDIIKYLEQIGIPAERKSIYSDLKVFEKLGVNIKRHDHSYYYEHKKGDFIDEITTSI